MLFLCIMLVYAWPGTQITSGAIDHNDPDSAPGVNTIVYTVYNASIFDYVVATNVRGGGNEINISTDPTSYGVDSPDITVDGEVVYLRANDTGWNWDQIYVNVGGVETEITHDNTTKYNPVACPDGDTIIFSATNSTDNADHMYKVLISSNVLTQLTFGTVFNDGQGNNWNYRYDCGDTHAVFTRCSIPFSRCNIAKVPLAGGAVVNLTADSGSNYFEDPQWNADYTQVIFTGALGPGWANTVFTVNADGSGITNLTNTYKNYWQPFYCPDGTAYAVHRPTPGVYNISQVLPNLTDNLARTNYGLYGCTEYGSHDIFYTLNDGSDDQILQQHFQDPPEPYTVPEFTSLTFLLAGLIAIGGMFALRRYR